MINNLKKVVLRRLVRNNIWGAKHTPTRFVLRAIPNHFKNAAQGKRMIKQAFKELQNNLWVQIIHKKTGKKSEPHISLNPRKVEEIKQFLKR